MKKKLFGATAATLAIAGALALVTPPSFIII